MDRRNVLLCWIVTAPALTAALMLGVLLTPELSRQGFLYIPVAALLGFLYGAPLARVAAEFLEAPARRDPLPRWGWGL